QETQEGSGGRRSRSRRRAGCRRHGRRRRIGGQGRRAWCEGRPSRQGRTCCQGGARQEVIFKTAIVSKRADPAIGFFCPRLEIELDKDPCCGSRLFNSGLSAKSAKRQS